MPQYRVSVVVTREETYTGLVEADTEQHARADVEAYLAAGEPIDERDGFTLSHTAWVRDDVETVDPV